MSPIRTCIWRNRNKTTNLGSCYHTSSYAIAESASGPTPQAATNSGSVRNNYEQKISHTNHRTEVSSIKTIKHTGIEFLFSNDRTPFRTQQIRKEPAIATPVAGLGVIVDLPGLV